jgi:SAM-dependent methyltransferase
MITPMSFGLNRVINLEDFQEPVVRDAIREIYARDAAESPEFPSGREHRKQWEIAMAALALEDGAVLRPDAEVLGIGAGSEATLFWLTNYVRRVWATDLYADPGSWVEVAPPTMLIDPGSAWNGTWNKRRLIVQHMDACELHYEDETFDGIFSSGSIEHFGSLERIGIAMDEAFRVLKRGGTASFSTEFLIEGDALAFEAHTVCFTPELLERVVVGTRDWLPTTRIEYRLSEATIATEIESSEYAAREARGESIHPHVALRVPPNLITSVHIALRKASRPNGSRLVTPGRAPIALAHDVAASAASTPNPGSRSMAAAAAADSSDTLMPVSVNQQRSNFKQLARRLARPVLSPVDGRVADINRRIDHVRATTERSLDAYSRSSSEATSYIGVELRRLHDRLAELEDQQAALVEQQAALLDQQAALLDQQAGLRDQLTGLEGKSFEEYYRARLGEADGMPLENLDESLAQVINYAGSDRGFYSQAGLWFNPPIAVALGAGAASAVHVTERIAEVPFALAALSRLERGARILDIGSADSTFPLSAASLGYEVTAIDPRRLGYSHPNLESHATLLEDWGTPSETFAAAFLISTIEHVGLGAYGERAYGSPEHGVGVDVALLDRVRELLAPDGLMILSTPYGSRELTAFERVYDDETLDKLLSNWHVLERQIVVRRDPHIWERDEKVVTGARGVVMLIASPKHS